MNPADASAAQAIQNALDHLFTASFAWTQKDKALSGSQALLADADKKLKEAQAQANVQLENQAKQLLSMEREKQLSEQKAIQPGADVPQNVSIDGNTPVNGAAPLAPGKESGIIREDGKWLPSGAVMTLPGIGNVPFRALAFAGAATDIRYANRASAPWPQPGAPFEVTDEKGNIRYGPDGDVDVEMIDSYPNVTPKPTQAPAATPKATTTPAPITNPMSSTYTPQYATNLGGKDGYKFNAKANPGVNENSLMPLGYQKQSVSDMGFYEFTYAAGSIYNSKKNGLVECVGMNRLPAITWFSYDMYKKLESEKKMSTYTGAVYDNASRKGRMTADMEDTKFDGMQLFSEKTRTLEDGTKEKYKNHVVTYYKEITMEFPAGKDLSAYKDCGQSEVRVVYSQDKKTKVQVVTFYDVVVHISGKRKDSVYKGETLTEKRANELNKQGKKEIIIEPYESKKYPYWCALDYVDYGDQKIPDSNE